MTCRHTSNSMVVALNSCILAVMGLLTVTRQNATNSFEAF